MLRNFFHKYIAWLTQALFILSMLSGMILLFAYYPFDAYNCVQKINYIIPFGSFFRQLHYFSSELFIIMLLIHISIELYTKYINTTWISWHYAILATMVLFVLMFTGFVLKADQSANAAAQVAFSLMSNTPILNKFLTLFKDTHIFYWKFFIWHIIFLPLILSYAIYKHTKRLNVDIKYFTIALGMTLLTALVISMPIDIALETKVIHIQGPWFFWGAENLLQLGLNAILINIILLLPFLFLYMIYLKKYNKIFKILLIVWVVVYIYFSFHF